MPDSNMSQQSQPQMQQAQQQQQPTQSNQQQNQDLVNCDLTNLQSLNCNDSESDELLRQLTEDTFELETFFSEFSAADIKVSGRKSRWDEFSHKIHLNFRKKTTMT